MKDQIVVALNHLADKLGTTSTYLWSVTVRQAPVYATVTLLEMVGVVLVYLVIWKLRFVLQKVFKAAVDSGDDAPAFVLFILTLVFVVILAVFTLFLLLSINDVVTAYANPEYWALDTILNALKAK